jgi:hypothetical protein
MFTLCVVKTSDDFIIVKDKYCEVCLLKKLDIVSKYEITIEEAKIFGTQYSVKGCIIKCACLGK